MANNSIQYTKRWNESGSLRFAEFGNGFTIRYLKDGQGPNLLLMHTARSQLDYFQRLIPLLRDHYTIYAPDLPGHGWSSIDRNARYDEPLFRQSMLALIERLGLDRVTLCGDSIGAVLSLTVAAEIPDKVVRAVPVNLFDYPQGVRRANFIANVIIGLYLVPGIRHIVSNMENELVLRAILRGGYHDPSRLPRDLLKEFRRVGRRCGYSAVMRSLFASQPSFVNARQLYGRVAVPATLVYGEHDWAKPEERNRNAESIKNAGLVTLDNTGHFASLEQPEAIASILLDRE